MNRICGIIILLAISLIACKRNALDINVSGIEADVKVDPFFENLFAADTSDMKTFADKFSKEYGNYWQIYNLGVINTGNPDLNDFSLFLSKFINNPQVRELADSCRKEFANYKHIEEDLEGAFKHLKYYYPKAEIPKILFHISGFNQSIVIDSGFISVSVDNYLGENSKYYKAMMTPLYLRKKMSKDRIARDVVMAYAMTEFAFRPKSTDLISNILYHAKIRYFLWAMMPQLTEAEVMGYSEEQLQWCKNNEERIWEFFVTNKYLFSTDYKTIMKYINDGPFTSGMPKESPGMSGVWLGLQIIKSYMQESKSELTTVMKENDYNYILRKSAYQP